MGDDVKGLNKAQIENIYPCSPLVYQDSNFIVQVYQVGQHDILLVNS